VVALFVGGFGLGVPLLAGGFPVGFWGGAGSTDVADLVDGGLPLEGSVSVDPFAGLPVELARELPPVPALADAGNGNHIGDGLHPYSRRVRASFSLQVRDVTIPYRVLAITAVPGERIELEIAHPGEGEGPADFRLRTEDGTVPAAAPGRWIWTAPAEPGPVPIRVEAPDRGDAILLNVLVLHPFDEIENGVLDGYRIGEYRTGPGREEPPAGFIRASADVLDLRVAPGFTLGQFLSHQPGNPRYLALSEPLLLKLEALLEEVRAEGVEVETLQVMSAFRTPHYNRAIGNTTDGSRHLWGDAADVYLDLDGWMGEADARRLLRIAERVERRGEEHVRPGGLSLYRANAVRGPFVHVDARGVPARW
jgi:hypothetical protein